MLTDLLKGWKSLIDGVESAMAEKKDGLSLKSIIYVKGRLRKT